MGILDTLHASNSIEHAPSPELAPEPGASLAQPGAQPGQLGTKSSTTTDPANIQATYYIEQAGKERRYYRDIEGKDLAFRASGKALTTKQEDRATIAHMLDVAQARGWGELHVRGSAAFKQEAWIEGQARGLSVKGYEPTADDRRTLDARRKTRQERTQPAEARAQAKPAENTITSTAQPVVQPASPPAPAAAAQAEEPQPPAQRERKGVDASTETGQRKTTKAETSTAEQPAQQPAKSGEQQFPRHTKAPWMFETGGYEALSQAQQESAQRSHERWLASGTEERPRTMGLEDYVSHVQEKEAEAKAKAGERAPKAQEGNPGPVLAPSAPAQTVAAKSGAAEAAQLSPDAKKVLSFVEQRIESQMAQFSREVKEELRAHAAQALAKREAEGKPVRVPDAKPRQKQAAKQEGEQATMRVSMG